MIKKSYNPFKMWGSYATGAIILITPWLLFFVAYIDCYINQQTDCGFGLGILFGLAIFFSLVGLILGFLIGWGIHSLIRKLRR